MIRGFMLAKETLEISTELFDIYMNRGDYAGILESVGMMQRSLTWREKHAGTCYRR